MPLESVEGYNRISSESSPEKGKYLDIERGDVDQMYLQQSQPQNQQQTQQPVQQNQFDPVTFVKGMISTGFTPSPSQISSSNANLTSDDNNSADHWFAIFLQRLMSQAKVRRKKK